MFQVRDDARLPSSEGGRVLGAAGTPEAGQIVGEVQGDAPIVFAQPVHAAPNDLAGGGERVEMGGLVALDPGRKDRGLEKRRD